MLIGRGKMENTFKNRYVRRAKISERQFRKLVRCFVEDLSATQIAEKIELNRNTVNRYMNEIRIRISEFCEQYNPLQNQTEELVEETPVESATLSQRISKNFGLLKRRGKVYAEMIANLAPNKLQWLQSGKLETSEVAIHSVDIRDELGMVAVGYDNNPELAGKPSYVDDLNRFWVFARERMSKFQGVAKHKFYLHMKECEFRFNFRNDNLYGVLLKMLATYPITPSHMREDSVAL